MVIQKTGATDRDMLMAILETTPPVGLAGGFGFSWALAMQVAGWIIQGIGLGKSVYDATREAGEKIPEGERLDQQDVDAVATALQQKFPTTTKASWASLLNEALAGKVGAPPGQVPEPCPTGFYRDPVTGGCLELKKEFEMPTWGWIAVGIGGLMVLPQLLSALKPR